MYSQITIMKVLKKNRNIKNFDLLSGHFVNERQPEEKYLKLSYFTLFVNIP